MFSARLVDLDKFIPSHLMSKFGDKAERLSEICSGVNISKKPLWVKLAVGGTVLSYVYIKFIKGDADRKISHFFGL